MFNTTKIVLIAACDLNGGIGFNGKIQWHLPNDFKHFKQHTLGKTIIMGRKTFESLPGILPSRKHVVLTNNKNYKPAVDNDNVIIVHTIDDALSHAHEDNTAYVIGGGDIYDLFIEYADTIELTQVHTNVNSDAYFPMHMLVTKFSLINITKNTTDDKHKFSYDFQTWSRYNK